MNKLIVKVGTNVITKENGLLNLEILASLVSQISALQKNGTRVILVSSGAMGAGRALIDLKNSGNDVVKRQVLASIGQIKLLETYLKLFQKEGGLCSQVLVTKEDFRDRMHYLNMKNCFEALLANGVTPIVNENDVISVAELMFTDNDELAGLIAAMMNVEKLIILSNVDGILINTENDAKILHTVDARTNLQKYIKSGKSSFGRGGMLTKAKMARRLAEMGITTYIANGKAPSILQKILSGKKIGTEFRAGKKKSSLKRWMASNEGNEKAIIHINSGAESVLKEKIASLLPVGITQIEGEFKKGDTVKIRNANKEDIGIGIASYGSEIAQKIRGEKGKKALIHYDYLFLKK